MIVYGNRKAHLSEQIVDLKIEFGIVETVGWGECDAKEILEPSRRSVTITDPKSEVKLRRKLWKLDPKPNSQDGFAIYRVFENNEGTVDVWCTAVGEEFYFMCNPKVKGGKVLARLFTEAFKTASVHNLIRVIVLTPNDSLAYYCAKNNLKRIPD